MSEHIRTIITIARQYGSGGREIGEMLAKKLDVPYYDKELIALAASCIPWSWETMALAAVFPP